MAGSKRDMPRRMPVLGADHVGEALAERVDDRDDLLAVLHGEAAARQKTVLDVDDDQSALHVGLDVGARRDGTFDRRGEGGREEGGSKSGEGLPPVQDDHDTPPLARRSYRLVLTMPAHDDEGWFGGLSSGGSVFVPNDIRPGRPVIRARPSAGNYSF